MVFVWIAFRISEPRGMIESYGMNREKQNVPLRIAASFLSRIRIKLNSSRAFARCINHSSARRISLRNWDGGARKKTAVFCPISLDFV
jgi:hypothetical protein